MNVTLINLGSVAVPFSSSQDKGFVASLEPSEPFIFNSEIITVANVGDNPSATEEFTTGLKHFLEKLTELITFWKDSAKATPLETSGIVVNIENHGPNGLRVLLGSNINEVTIPALGNYAASAAEYVEIRELGV